MKALSKALSLNCFALALFASACAMQPKTRTPSSDALPAPLKASTPTTPVPPALAAPAVDTPKVHGPSLAESGDPKAAPDPVRTLASEHPNAVAPEKALEWLEHGNTRFVKRHFRNDGLTAKDRERLAKGQSPHTIVLACSDSRVPPEHIFDQALGEIFVIRVAGEALDSSVVGSIEYAVEHLGTRLVLVLGHDSCGAVNTALATAKGQSAGSESLDRMVADIRPRLEGVARTPASEGLIDESSANVKGVMKDLLTRSPILKKFSDEGWLQVRGGLYHLSSGQVDFFH